MSFVVPDEGIAAGPFTLRWPEPGDAEAIIGAFADPAIAGPMDFPVLSDDELRGFVAGGARMLADAGEGMALMIDADGELLGGCSLWTVNWELSVADLGYWLLPAARGRGAATEAARALAAYGHESGLHRIQAFVHVGNDASLRVLERAGFTHEGVLRSRGRRRGGRVDMHLFSHLPGE